MSIKNKAYIVGIYEHPTRKAEDKSLAQLHAELAKGAIEDAGLSKSDIDGYFCAGDAPGLGTSVDGRLHGPQIEAHGFDRLRRLVLPHPCWACRGGDCARQMQVSR